jgi:integrase
LAQTIDFTIRTIEALPSPAKGRVEFRDSRVPGLYLRVTDAGVKTFSFIGRAKGSSRVERVTFGKYPAVKPEEARQRARMLAGDLASGVSAAAASRERRGESTLSDLFGEYKKSLTARGRKSVDGIEALWLTHVEPAFGTRRLSEVTGMDVERWHRAIPAAIIKRREAAAAERKAKLAAKRAAIAASQAVRRRGPDPKPRPDNARLSSLKVTGHRTANQALEVLRALYNWAAEPQRALFSGVNPAAGHEVFANRERERFLQPNELKPFFEALATEPSETIRDFVLLAVLTGARRANVIAMRWENIDLARAEWRVPGEVMKNGQPQTITLTGEAVELLKRRHERHAGEWVFPSDKSETGHFVEPRKGWQRILRASGLRDLRIHDLRRTLGSWQARTGASLVLIGKSLNHKSPDATAIYARLDLDPVRQSVERATAAMFEAAGVTKKAAVVPIDESNVARKATRKK